LAKMLGLQQKVLQQLNKDQIDILYRNAPTW
jgi:hypothetical protein